MKARPVVSAPTGWKAQSAQVRGMNVSLLWGESFLQSGGQWMAAGSCQHFLPHGTWPTQRCMRTCFATYPRHRSRSTPLLPAKSAWILHCASCIFVSHLTWNASDPTAITSAVFRLVSISGLTGQKSFLPLLFFSHVFAPGSSLGIDLNPTIGKTSHHKKLWDSLQFQIWLLPSASVVEQPKRQCISWQCLGTLWNKLLWWGGISNSSLWPALMSVQCHDLIHTACTWYFHFYSHLSLIVSGLVSPGTTPNWAKSVTSHLKVSINISRSAFVSSMFWL